MGGRLELCGALTRAGHVRWMGCEVPRRPRARARRCVGA
jgi:hypothetical protein